MGYVVIQISDIHSRDGRDNGLSRVPEIVAAVRGIHPEVKFCLIALTGDLAFSGKASEYEPVVVFVQELVRSLRSVSAQSVGIEVCAIPGNHDCDFSAPAVAREHLIESMSKKPDVMAEAGVSDLCCAVQESFFMVRDRIAAHGLIEQKGKVYYEYSFEGVFGSVRVRCLNTAWVSRLHESAGSLTYPTDLFDDSPTNGRLEIVLMHHPANWLQPMQARELRRRVQRSAHITLTGHEHDFAARSARDDSGGSLLQIEATAFSPAEASEPSGFNVLIVDDERTNFRCIPFEWEGASFVAQPSEFSEWTPLGARTLGASHGYRVRSSVVGRLEDPGIDLSHPTRGTLKLNDIFVYPDLRQVDLDPSSQSPRIVSSKRLLPVAREAGVVLITGARESGRTCLAKRLFVDALDVGLVPILADGRISRFRGDKIRDEREVERLFEDQYDCSSDEYRAVKREHRVVILDDYHAIDLRTAPAVIEALSHIAGTVILLAHDLSQHVLEVAGIAASQRGLPVLLHYQIMAYGHVRRDELIDRYVQLSRADETQAKERLRADMRRLLDTALGKQYAPAVPVVIVSLLQARAFNDELQIGHSTYGYYYELLIKRSLANSVQSEEYDVSMAYLTALCGRLFADAGKRTWDESWFVAFHESFNVARKLRLKFVNVEKTLVERGVLVRKDGQYEFRHAYYRYYFTAQSLADKLPTDEGKRVVTELSKKLAEDDAANTLLFLTHLSKDASVIDPMLAQAERVFADSPRATLERNTVALPGNNPELDESIRKAVYEDMPIHQSREKLLGQMDGQRANSTPTLSSITDEHEARLERSGEVAEMVSYSARVNEAFRIMQILGQVLKNFPGTLDGQQKLRITTAVYDVGLRVLGSVHDLLRTRIEDAVSSIVIMLRETHPDMQNFELSERARDLVGYYVYISAYGTVQRIASHVGHPLLEPVFDEIDAASSEVVVKLVTSALKLDTSGPFPVDRVTQQARDLAKNPMALRVLRSLVVTHFHLFDVPRTTKQSVCALLGIEYRPALPPSADRKRLVMPRK